MVKKKSKKKSRKTLKTSESKGDSTTLLALAGVGAALVYLLTGEKPCQDGETRQHICPDGSTITQTCISGRYSPECTGGIICNEGEGKTIDCHGQPLTQTCVNNRWTPSCEAGQGVAISDVIIEESVEQGGYLRPGFLLTNQGSTTLNVSVIYSLSPTNINYPISNVGGLAVGGGVSYYTPVPGILIPVDYPLGTHRLNIDIVETGNAINRLGGTYVDFTVTDGGGASASITNLVVT